MIHGLSVECQFLLCLMILRRDKSFEECAILFGLSDTLISQVFKTWLGFLHVKLKDVQDYVDSLTLEDLPKPPKAFRNKLLRKVRFVLDTTSFKCQSTTNYRTQGNNWSDYKKHTVYNSAIMISPTGFLQGISPLAQGSISDRELYKRSGFNKKLRRKDRLLVDRGFDIKNITIKTGAVLVMPPFLKKRKRFTYREMLDSKIITRAR